MPSSATIVNEHTAPVGIDQWSRGQYTGANNPEDDINIIARSVGTRVSTPTNPAACVATAGYQNLAAVSSTVTTTYPTATITCAGILTPCAFGGAMPSR